MIFRQPSLRIPESIRQGPVEGGSLPANSMLDLILASNPEEREAIYADGRAGLMAYSRESKRILVSVDATAPLLKEIVEAQHEGRLIRPSSM